MRRRAPIASSLSAAWHDPHEGKGGLGASTAQFAAVAALGERLGAWQLGLSPSASREGGAPDWKIVLELYRRCSWSGEGPAPSGADLVAQIAGGLCAYDGHRFQARVFEWPFPGLDFTLLRTGSKVPTHEHLRTANADAWPLARLAQIARDAIAAVESADPASFASTIDAYGEALASAGLCAPSTRSLIAQARQILGPNVVLAAKGCGAMGADILALVHPAAAAPSVAAWAQRTELARAGGSRDLAPGGLSMEGRI